MKFFRNAQRESLGGLITLAVGILLFVSPRTAARTLVSVGGVLMLIYGVGMLLDALNNSAGMRSAALPGAVMRIALGVFMAISPNSVVRLACTIIGIYLLLDALFSFSDARAAGRSMIGAILSLVLGLVLLVNPLRAVMSVMQWSGVALMITGAFNLASGTTLRRY